MDRSLTQRRWLFMFQRLSNPQAAHLLTQITAAKKMVALIEGTLSGLQAKCTHDFRITNQGMYVYGFGYREGDAVFRRNESCLVCGMTHQVEDNPPYCIDCRQPMLSATYSDMVENLAEFEQAYDEGSLAKEIFPMGTRSGYRCEHCGRAHVYRAGGD